MLRTTQALPFGFIKCVREGRGHHMPGHALPAAHSATEATWKLETLGVGDTPVRVKVGTYQSTEGGRAKAQAEEPWLNIRWQSVMPLLALPQRGMLDLPLGHIATCYSFEKGLGGQRAWRGLLKCWSLFLKLGTGYTGMFSLWNMSAFTFMVCIYYVCRLCFSKQFKRERERLYSNHRKKATDAIKNKKPTRLFTAVNFIRAHLY